VREGRDLRVLLGWTMLLPVAVLAVGWIVVALFR
jgi:hypothetical protein